MALIKKINQYNTGIPAALHEIKWAKMRKSPFDFYRANCFLFAADFAKLYNQKPKVKTWICGDAHLENFGSYKGQDRQIYFDLNDFDEAILASPEAEMARFLTSVIIAAGQMSAAYVKLHKALHDIMEAYTAAIAARKAMLMQPAIAKGEFRHFFEAMSTLDRNSFIQQRTLKQKGALLINTDGTRYAPLEENRKLELYDSLNPVLKAHPAFAEMVFEDAAFRIAGTGSLGLNRYAALLFSRKKGKHYMLDIKATRTSCNNVLTSLKQPKFKNEAERIVYTGYLMQYNAPAFMVPHKIGDKWYVVKELQPANDKIAVSTFNNDFGKLTEVAIEMAKLLAYAHLRSSGNIGASSVDDLVKFAGKKQWQKDIIDLSGTLAKKNEQYYKTFCK